MVNTHNLLQISVHFPDFIIEATKHNASLSERDLSLINEYQREIQRSLPETLERIVEIDAEIARLQQRRVGLDNIVKSKHKLLFAGDVAKSPFRRIPPEIHAIILSYCNFEMSSGTTSHFSPPLPLFCHVSSIWRNIALTTPGLWKDVCIYFNKSIPSFERVKHHLDYFALYSRELPMNIRLLFPDDHAQDAYRERHELFYSIVNYVCSDSDHIGNWGHTNVNRIHSLDIQSPFLRTVLQNFYMWKNTRVTFQSLKYLTLRGSRLDYYDGDDAIDYISEPLCFILRSPNLKYVSLDFQIDLARNMPLSKTGPLFSTCLYVPVESPDHWMASLQKQYVNLRKGYFFFKDLGNQGRLMPQMTQYNSLEDLALHYQGHALGFLANLDIFYPLRMVRFPRLKRLQISLPMETAPGHSSNFWTIGKIDLVVSSLPMLREMTLLGTWRLTSSESPSPVFYFLQHFSNLTILNLEISTKEYDQIISMLTVHHSRETRIEILPSLSELALDIVIRDGRHLILDTTTSSDFVQLVYSRCHPKRGPFSGLEKVHLFLAGNSYGPFANDFIRHVEQDLTELVARHLLFLEIFANTGNTTLRYEPLRCGMYHWERDYFP